MRITNLFFTAFFLLVFCVSFTAQVDAKDDEPLPVFVSIQPQAYFVERIGGERVSVQVLVLPGKSPATYAPTPAQMAMLARAKVFFRIGVPFEDALMDKIKSMCDHLLIIDTRKGIQLRKMAMAGHDEEGDDDHHHGANGNDPHIWLNPMLVKIQAETILHTLVEIDPEGKTEYTENYISFINDLDRLHAKLGKSLEPVKGQMFFVFHPSFGYFADAYGLKQMAVETEGKAPKGKDLSLFIKRAKEAHVRVIFVQPQFDQSAATRIAASINGAVVAIDPLSKEYIQNLEDVADKIVVALTH